MLPNHRLPGGIPWSAPSVAKLRISLYSLSDGVHPRAKTTLQLQAGQVVWSSSLDGAVAVLEVHVD